MQQTRAIYLDWNATTPPAPEVLDAMRDARADNWGNPASVHCRGRQARSVLESCREVAASVLGVEARDLFFTSGGTEANNLALWGAPGLVTSRLEHPSVVRVAEWLESVGRPVRWARVDREGRAGVDSIQEALSELPQGSTIAIAAVNHETGVIQIPDELMRLCGRFGARLHVDAVQALGKIDARIFQGAHSIAVSAHKLRGPKGIGALAWTGPPPVPVLRGGSQERGVRPGTQDAALAAGFLVALERSVSGPRRYAALAAHRDRLEAAMLGYAEVNGAGQRAPHVSNLAFAEWRADELVAALDLQGICASSGSACSAGSSEASPVIAAMLGEQRALRSVRFSFGETTTDGELDVTIRELLRHVGGE